MEDYNLKEIYVRMLTESREGYPDDIRQYDNTPGSPFYDDGGYESYVIELETRAEELLRNQFKNYDSEGVKFISILPIEDEDLGEYEVKIKYTYFDPDINSEMEDYEMIKYKTLGLPDFGSEMLRN